MIIQPNQLRREERLHMREGNGTVVLEHFFEMDQLPPKTRLAARIILEKGVSIGRHTHQGESEIYYVLQGTANATEDGGPIRHLQVGDVTLTCSGQEHYLEGTSEEPCIVLAFVILE